MEKRTHGLLARHTSEKKRHSKPAGMFPQSFNLNDLSGRNLHKAVGPRTQNSDGDWLKVVSHVQAGLSDLLLLA